MSFGNVAVLYLVWVIPLLGVVLYRHLAGRDAQLRTTMIDELREKIIPSAATRRRNAQLALMMVGLFALLLAIARPQWGTQEQLVYQHGRDLVIALDVSRSMLARDVHPNRLERAKADIIDLIRDLQGDRAALLAFRGRANVICPITSDHAYLRQAVETVSSRSAPRGETNIGDAIRKSLEVLDADSASHQAIILISDGEDLGGEAEDAAHEAAERGVPIFAIGLGDSRGTKIPSPDDANGFVAYEGEDVLTRLNHETLQMLQRITGGYYLPVGQSGMTSTTLGTLYSDHMRSVQARDTEERRRSRKIERFQPFVLVGVLCLMAAGLLSRGRIVLRRAAALNAVLLLLLPLAASGASNEVNATTGPSNSVPAGRSGAREAQTLYRTGLFSQAAEAYLSAAEGATRTSQADFLYNAAVCLHRAKRYERAAEILAGLVSRKEADAGSVHFNRAVALYRAAKEQAKHDDGSTDRVRSEALMSEAGEALLESLRLDGSASDARASLAALEDSLPQMRKDARHAKLMSEHGEQEPFKLVDSLLKEQRAVIEAMPDAFTDKTPARITRLEALSAQQRAAADLAIPLKAKLSEGATMSDGADVSAEQLEQLSHFIDGTAERMRESADSLRDLNTRAFETAVQAENEVYGMWKAAAPFARVLDEALYRQTNAIQASAQVAQSPTDAALNAIAQQQGEAEALTTLFEERMAQQWPEGPGADGDASSVTNRARAVELTKALKAEQALGSAGIADRKLLESMKHQRRSHDLMTEIKRLIPQDPQENQEQQDQEDQDDQEQQDQEDQQSDPSEQDPEQDQQDDPNDDPQEQPPEEEPSEQPQPSPSELTEEQLEQLLQRARMREEEYREEKEKRQQQLQMPLIDKDW